MSTKRPRDFGDVRQGVRWSRALVLTVVGGLLVSACTGGAEDAAGGGGGGLREIPVAMVGLQPLEHGFAFANFPAVWYEEEFEAEDLVAMFGDDPSVCVDGIADPCELTAEAAAFARMVNQTRAGGHCEGLVAVAQARYNLAAEPPTAALPDESETIRAIMRAFATQFIPEVRDEIQMWLGTSLADKVQALVDSFEEGVARYSLGVYTSFGGHAVLPYAVEWRTPTQPRIMLYDSNWPGRNRYVDVDLKTETWSFSFSGDDPENDPEIWTGPAGFMDLTAIETRSGTCPFCDGAVTATKNLLLVRSTDLDWSVEADGVVVSPASPGAEGDAVVATPIKGSGVTSDGRKSFDYVVEVPISANPQERAALNLPGTASVFALTPTGIAQITTPGNPEIPVEVGAASFVSRDPAVSLSLAAGNLVASASGPTASLTISDQGMQVAVTTEDGQVVEVEVTPETPAAVLSVDPTAGQVQVLAQSASGVVERREISADGSVSVSIETTPLNLSATTWQAPPGLESAPLPALPPPDARNLDNPNYATDAPYTPPAPEPITVASAPVTTPPVSAPPLAAAPATVPRPVTPPTVAPANVAPATTLPRPPPTTPPATTTPPTTVPPTTVPPTTVPRTTTPPTTVPPTTVPPTTVPPTTTVPPPTTAPPPPPPPPTTTTTLPPVQTAIAIPDLESLVIGDGPATLILVSNNPAAVTVTSSDADLVSVETMSVNSVRLRAHSLGTVTLTISQPASAGFTAVTLTRQVTVVRREQAPLSITSLMGGVGVALPLITSGGSGSGAVTFSLDSGAPECTLTGSSLARTTAGTCTVTATKAADDQHNVISSEPSVISFEQALTRTLLYETRTPRRSGNVIVYEGNSGTGPNDRARTLDAQGWEVTRVYYRMEVEFEGTLRYVEVSFDPWTGVTADGLRVPDLDTARDRLTIREFVENMTVISNMTPDQMTATESARSTGVITGTGRRGYLELWPWNYDTVAWQGGPAGSNNSRYDFNDTPSMNNGYGSFQVHDITVAGSERTVLAWNRHSENPAAEVGMGSYRGDQPDWTFSENSANSLGTHNWSLQIFADLRIRVPQASLTVSSVFGAVGYPVALTTSGGSGSGAVTYALAMGASPDCTLTGSFLTRTSAGTCTITATKTADADYLAATSQPAVITFVGEMHGVVNENATLTLTAPAGLQFAEVVFASYGTPTGSGPFQIHGCHNADSVSTVSAIAVGATSFSVGANNTMFADPCVGTQKRLAVSVRLEPIWTPLQATGGTVTDVTIDGVAYRLHTFTTVGADTFSVTHAGSTGEIEYLIVGGGGGGGHGNSNEGGGGGGAGGLVTTLGAPIAIGVGEHPVTVGAGGTGAAAANITAVSGGLSAFMGITALGGGGGGSCSSTPGSGGSGGGGSGCGGDIPGAAGTAGQGHAGGSGRWIGNSPGQGNGGGGGGAGGPGHNGAVREAGTTGGAGLGLSNSITGIPVIYAAGGDGFRGSGNGSGAPGAPGTGNGADGSAQQNAPQGGSGIVIIRYRLSPPTP